MMTSLLGRFGSDVDASLQCQLDFPPTLSNSPSPTNCQEVEMLSGIEKLLRELIVSVTIKEAVVQPTFKKLFFKFCCFR